MNTGSYTLSFIKPHAVEAGAVPVIKQIVQDNGFSIVVSKPILLTASQVINIYPFLTQFTPEDTEKRPEVIANTTGEIELLILWHPSDNTAEHFQELRGKTASVLDQYALDEHPGTGLRSIFAVDGTLNAIHSADSEADAINELRIIDPFTVEDILRDPLWRDSFYEALSRQFTDQKELTQIYDLQLR